jgi:hypothetical protein
MYANQAIANKPPVGRTPSDGEDFIIPELPRGKLLAINIRSTWGDTHYVGLNGIEVFSNAGTLVEVNKVSQNENIRYKKVSLNVLKTYSHMRMSFHIRRTDEASYTVSIIQSTLKCSLSNI